MKRHLVEQAVEISSLDAERGDEESEMCMMKLMMMMMFVVAVMIHEMTPTSLSTGCQPLRTVRSRCKNWG